MGQERLSGLAVISINAELTQNLSCDDLNVFAARKCRRVTLSTDFISGQSFNLFATVLHTAVFGAILCND